MYIDLIFLLNALADWAALWTAGRLAGQVPRPRRLLPAAGLGGVYGVLCALPPLAALGGFFGQLMAALAVTAAAFGLRRGCPRLALLFYAVSCAMGGALMAVLRLLEDSGGLELLGALNWRVFLLVGGGTYLLLSLFLRGGARQAAEGRLLPVKISRGGRTARLAALLDQLLDGQGSQADLDTILRTAQSIVDSADCAIGFEAAQMVLDLSLIHI